MFVHGGKVRRPRITYVLIALLILAVRLVESLPSGACLQTAGAALAGSHYET